jgi:hypothetical protein
MLSARRFFFINLGIFAVQSLLTFLLIFLLLGMDFLGIKPVFFVISIPFVAVGITSTILYLYVGYKAVCFSRSETSFFRMMWVLAVVVEVLVGIGFNFIYVAAFLGGV